MDDMFMSRRSLAALLSLVVSVACSPADDGEPSALTGDGTCTDAADLVESCTGKRPAAPEEGCVGSYAAAAEQVLAGGCGALDASGGKADEGGFFCRPNNLWLGLCRERPLAEVAHVAALSDVCSGAGTSALCDALQADDWARARAEVRALVGALPREQLVRRDDVRFYFRQRTTGLLARNVALDSSGADVRSRAEAALREHFPAYEAGVLSVAAATEPFEASGVCAAPRARVVVFPGVTRPVGRAEYAQQLADLEAALPCITTLRIDTDSFIAPAQNANVARAAIALADAAEGELPMLFIGYSQGARNSLQTLVDHPEIGARVRSALTMNSAARGSELADLMLRVLQGLSVGTSCDEVAPAARPLCEWANRTSPRPAEFLLEAAARALGVPLEQLETYMALEQQGDAPETLSQFLLTRLEGVRSLSTGEGEAFWSGPAKSLPAGTLFTSFRSAISRRSENLPQSNLLPFELMKRAGATNPYNDMMVLLDKQRLGGPVADREVALPVAEGNHWQWPLSNADIPTSLMPKKMADRIPRSALILAHVQVLLETGLVD